MATLDGLLETRPTMETVKVITFAPCEDLMRLSAPFHNMPYPKVLFRNWAPDYFKAILAEDADWLVHVDVDALLIDPSRVTSLIQHMKLQGFVCAGMPDGGAVWIRDHNPVACNAFFLIIHRAAIADAMKHEPNLLKTRWHDHYRKHTPSIAKNRGVAIQYDNYEHYYGFFNWLHKHCRKVLFLDACQWDGEPAGITTVLKDHEGQPFLLHTWYARENVVSVPLWEWLSRVPSLHRLCPTIKRPGRILTASIVPQIMFTLFKEIAACPMPHENHRPDPHPE